MPLLLSGLAAAAAALTLLAQIQTASAICEGQRPPANGSSSKLIIVFKDAADLAPLRLICTPDAAEFAAGRQDAGLGSQCHMPGVCTHMYTHALIGVAGSFSAQQLDMLSSCMPPNSTQYCKVDRPLQRAEGRQTDWVSNDSTNTDTAADSSAVDVFGRRKLLQLQQQPKFHQQLRRRPQQGKWRHTLWSAAARLLSGRSLSDKSSSEPMMSIKDAAGPTVAVEAPVSSPLPLPIVLPPLTVAAAGEQTAPTGVKVQQLGLASWNLDRIDQRNLPLDQLYTFGTMDTAGTGRGVTIYALDSGVSITHEEFLNWPDVTTRASYGHDFIDGGSAAPDCDGHGTIVASIAMGHTVGVAKEASLVALRVLDCQGAGSVSNVVAALDWVTHNGTKPSVATLSLGIPVGAWSQTLEDATTRVLAAGILVVVAAGNNDVDACTVAPANVPGALTVSASDLSTKWGVTSPMDQETPYRYANYGDCIDLYAPGVDIYAACGSSQRCSELNNTAYTFASGTSMAVPHAAGLAAIYLADNPTATPAEVHAAIVNAATVGRLNATELRPGTPNKMLYTIIPSTQVAAAQGPGDFAPQPEVQAAAGPDVEAP